MFYFYPILTFLLFEVASDDKQDNKSKIVLPHLNKLHWLSIDGCPPDGYLLQEILFVAPNLSMLIIDMKFLRQLIDNEDNQSCLLLLETRVKHLSIQISDEMELTEIDIEKLSNIFLRVRYLIIESKTSNNISFENIILLFLHHLKRNQLVSLIARGLTTETLRNNPSQWLIEHTYLNEYIDQFKAECDDIEFKIWL